MTPRSRRPDRGQRGFTLLELLITLSVTTIGLSGGNAGKLARAVDHLLSERQRYSIAARRSVLTRTWPAVCDQLLGHYEEVLGRRGAKAA